MFFFCGCHSRVWLFLFQNSFSQAATISVFFGFFSVIFLFLGKIGSECKVRTVVHTVLSVQEGG